MLNIEIISNTGLPANAHSGAGPNKEGHLEEKVRILNNLKSKADAPEQLQYYYHIFIIMLLYIFRPRYVSNYADAVFRGLG